MPLEPLSQPVEMFMFICFHDSKRIANNFENGISFLTQKIFDRLVWIGWMNPAHTASIISESICSGSLFQSERICWIGHTARAEFSAPFWTGRLTFSTNPNTRTHALTHAVLHTARRNATSVRTHSISSVLLHLVSPSDIRGINTTT